ncbi:MAG: proline--tRNA ligase [Spirochaetales bacterium]|jgi:prolyl-tRNA synthetase|nr:proline--tRNA ligase [Spirochaetales bacterium]
MRYSKLFGKGLPDKNLLRTDFVSHNLLLRGGYFKPAGKGFNILLPLGIRVLVNIKKIIRQELEKLGGQEILMPLAAPLNLYKKTGRDLVLGRDMIRFKDRSARALVNAPSHIEPVVELMRLSGCEGEDFPKLLFQFSRKFRDEALLNEGIFRGEEFLMGDAYSFHRDFSDLNNFFPLIFKTYKRIFARCGINVVSAESAVGSLTGFKAYEFLYLHPAGRASLIRCPSCGYTGNHDVAVGYKTCQSEAPLPLEEVRAEGVRNSEQAAAYFGVDLSRIAKTLVYRSRDGFAVALVRGDYELSEEKLSRFIMTPIVRLASPSEIRALGFCPGSLSPVEWGSGPSLSGVPIVVDDAVANGNNFIIGANRKDRYYRNFNIGRDFESPLVGDIVRLNAADRCFQCGEALESCRAIELGNIFKIGDYYTRAMNLAFRNKRGGRAYPNMGSYGIGLERLMAAAVEANHDERGILWPDALAPYQFSLIPLGKAIKVREAAGRLEAELGEHVLFDDRAVEEKAKFEDMDLLGIPYRLTISAKTLAEDGIEVFNRKTGETRTMPAAGAAAEIRKMIAEEF